MAFFSASNLAALAASTVRIATMAELRFENDTKRLWNGEYDIESGGETWQAMKGTGQIDGIPINSQQQSETVTFTLNGIPDSEIGLLAKATQETDAINQKSALVYLQLFDDGWQVSGSPIPVWWGFMQPPKVSRSPMQGDDGSTQTISLQAENAFFNRSRPPNGRYTDRDQQQRSDGDKFFQFTPNLLFSTWTYPDY